MKDAWLTALHDFKAYQQLLLETLRTSITSVYEIYEPDATVSQEEELLNNKQFRSSAISRMQSVILPNTAPHAPVDWQYESRFANYDLLKLDLTQVEGLCALARSPKCNDIAIREYDIAVNGDTILEFAKMASEEFPVLRFRVSSHMLIEASPYFARIFRSSYTEPHSPLEQLESLPPTPVKQVCRDGTEVKVYRMPQLELNKEESLTTLLHAAHMHNDKIPREVRFPELVSIAEVCLRYQCTGPLEMSVEYRWLPAWIHKANENLPEGFLLICYVFGLRRLFTRTSKSIILNTSTDEEIQMNGLWPSEVKEKIRAMREAKLAQVYAACRNTVQEYIRQPSDGPVSTTAAMSSTPRCPRGLHQCDATNLGWLTLAFNDLGMLHVTFGTDNSQQHAIPPQRSINYLVNHLRRMPSAPQMHSGVCDWAPAFRNAMNDVYNSVKGLTLLEVSGKEGWALSKRHDKGAQFNRKGVQYVDNYPQDVFELPAAIEQPIREPQDTGHELVALRIFSLLDDLEDIHAAAMIGKAWYSVYRKNELSIMRNLVKSKKRKTSPQTTGDSLEYQNIDDVPPSRAAVHVIKGPKLSPQDLLSPSAIQRSRLPRLETSNNGQYSITPPRSPRSPLEPLLETPLSAAEVEEILWPKQGIDLDSRAVRSRLNGMVHNLDPESNAKFLSGDILHVDKSLVLSETKHLRAEHDRALRMGPR
jgi:hypothetical protein